MTARGFSYYAEPYRSYKDDLKAAMQETWTDPPLDEEVLVRVDVYASPPKKSKLASPRPDVDNYLKAVFDAMNGIVFTDDSLVKAALVVKHWADSPEAARVEITLAPWRNMRPLADPNTMGWTRTGFI